MRIKIHVTKEIYRRAMYCGLQGGSHYSNCAIALAVRDIVPRAAVGGNFIVWDGHIFDFKGTQLPSIAVTMIYRFDCSTPIQRLLLPEFSFEVDFPDELVNEIGIDEVKAILKKSETLEIA